MELHFEWKGVEQYSKKSAQPKQQGRLQRRSKQGLWLVGDQGVYLMANTSDGVHNSKMEKAINISLSTPTNATPTRWNSMTGGHTTRILWRRRWR